MKITRAFEIDAKFAAKLRQEKQKPNDGTVISTRRRKKNLTSLLERAGRDYPGVMF